MQKDLDRISRQKRRKRNIVIVVSVSVFIALVGVGLRSCADQFSEPYNKDYAPLDASANSGGEER